MTDSDRSGSFRPHADGYQRSVVHATPSNNHLVERGTNGSTDPLRAPLHILHLEDQPLDAALVQAALESAGISCVILCVDNRADFTRALEHGGIDLVLSDYSLPTFDGLTAIAFVRARWPDLPVILVSGTLGEELAIDSLKGGATDYVLKSRLSRLAPAVLRAMREVAARAEARRLEAQFIEAQKMDGVGQLAGGVAHDFNNILGVIIGYSDLIAAKLEPKSVLEEYVGEIRHAADRAAGLTRQLLMYCRRQTVQLVVLDLNQVVRGLEPMLRRLIDENIEVEFRLSANLGNTRADAGHIGQVLMNLVVNARDAMPHGGKLTIATGAKKITGDTLPSTFTAVPGNYVTLEMTDTGSGMTDAVRGQLFKAFFTTKPKGHGTGLGLATCLSIVQQSSGYIEVVSEVGKGSTFRLYFPLIEQPVEAVTPTIPSGPMPRGNETLLVVEDEPSVRHLARGVLNGLGYEVLSASNGQEALHVARAHHGEPIRLVISDVIMPVMGGKVMAEWLTTLYPELKVLFTSGYTDDAISHHGVLDAGVEFLAKPYTPTALAYKVRESLDRGKLRQA